MRLVRWKSLIAQPWKNGGGTTTEIAAFPEGAGFDDFLWRISSAEVATDGPFSPFPGVNRTLVVFEGDGIALDIGGRIHRVDGRTRLVSFPGDEPAHGRLLAGPVRDLNVMTRRGRYAHRVRLLGGGQPVTIPDDAETAVLFAAFGPIQPRAGGRSHDLGAQDSLVLAPVGDAEIAVDADCCLIELIPERGAVT